MATLECVFSPSIQGTPEKYPLCLFHDHYYSKGFMRNLFTLVFVLFAGFALAASGENLSDSTIFHISRYELSLQPDIATRSITGTLQAVIHPVNDALRYLVLDCGSLAIDACRLNGENTNFTLSDGKMRVISSSKNIPANSTLEIQYHGTPKSGVVFDSAATQVFTIFSTEQWMPCLSSPRERASFTLHLLLPPTQICTSNGTLQARDTKTDGNILWTWELKFPAPAYTYGFAAGKFRQYTESHGNFTVSGLYNDFSTEQMKHVFGTLADMLLFFQEKAGVPYPYATYTQVFSNRSAAQEMCSFTVIDTGYVHGTLEDSTDIGMMAHELSHQWWGNMITCTDWCHFWLNEGMATFMVAAYREHRFGHTDYLAEVEDMRKVYEKVQTAGKDKSLVFADWKKPTRDDRRLVYAKGGYVLHLLKTELGDELFWKGIQFYTKTYWGKSVQTRDFQQAMESATGRNLAAFFNKWVYLK